jgi:ketosteroid isomerase-like protein
LTGSRETVQAFYDAINARRMDDALELLADDVRWSRPPDVPITGTLEGRGEVRRMWTALVESLERFEIAATGFEEDAGGESLMAIIAMRGTAPDGRGDFEFGGCQVFRVARGRIAEVREFRSLDEGREALATGD